MKNNLIFAFRWAAAQSKSIRLDSICSSINFQCLIRFSDGANRKIGIRAFFFCVDRGFISLSRRRCFRIACLRKLGNCKRIYLRSNTNRYANRLKSIFWLNKLWANWPKKLRENVQFSSCFKAFQSSKPNEDFERIFTRLFTPFTRFFPDFHSCKTKSILFASQTFHFVWIRHGCFFHFSAQESLP